MPGWAVDNYRQFILGDRIFTKTCHITKRHWATGVPYRAWTTKSNFILQVIACIWCHIYRSNCKIKGNWTAAIGFPSNSRFGRPPFESAHFPPKVYYEVHLLHLFFPFLALQSNSMSEPFMLRHLLLCAKRRLRDWFTWRKSNCLSTSLSVSLT